MRLPRWLIALPLLSPATARADDAAASRVQDRYDRATAAMEERRFEVACPLFDEAARARPEVVELQIAAAECYLRVPRLATALHRYEAIAPAPLAALGRARADELRARIGALRARVARVRVIVPDELRALRGVEISWDGEPLARRQWDEPFAVDRGRYTLAVEAPGRRPLQKTIEIERDSLFASIEVGVPALAVLPPPPPARPAHAEGSSIPGLVALSLGAAGLGLGVMTGAATLATKRSIQSSCRGGLCPPSQQAEGERAAHLATASTASFVVGSVLAATGVALLVLKPFGRSAPPASVSLGPGALQIQGSF